MEDNNNGEDVSVEGKPELHFQTSTIRVSPEYFDSVGTHVLMGRGITVQDTPTSATIAVINETFAKKFFRPGENPIGRSFGNKDEQHLHDYQIVGVVDDTVYQDVRWKDHLMFFTPLLQRPASLCQRWKCSLGGRFRALIRTSRL
jgi:hypothetical protein